MPRRSIAIWGCEVGFDALLGALPYEQLAIQTVNGVITGMILALVASGLTLIFGIMDVVKLRARRIVHARRLCRRHRACGGRQFLGRAGGREPADHAARSGDL